MSKPERSQQVAQAVEGILKEGDKFVIQRSHQHLTVTTPDKAEFPDLGDTHPELYGRLLEIGERLSKAERGFGRLIFLVAILLCAAIQMLWFRDWLGIQAERLQGFWVYALILFVAYLIQRRIAVMRGWLAYRRERPELLGALRDAGLARRHVLAKIEPNPSLRTLARRLKLDTEADQTVAFS